MARLRYAYILRSVAWQKGENFAGKPTTYGVHIARWVIMRWTDRELAAAAAAARLQRFISVPIQTKTRLGISDYLISHYSKQTFCQCHSTWSPVQCSGNTFRLINVLTLRSARLVPRWVTVFGRVNHLGAEPCRHPGLLSLSLPGL